MQQPTNEPTIIVQSPVRKVYPVHGKSIIGLSIALIVIGCLCSIFQTIGLIIGSDSAEFGAGIWCGLIFITTGSIGVVAGKRKTHCMVVTFLVFSILNSSFFSLVLLTIAAIGLDGDNGDYYWSCDYDGPGVERECSNVEMSLGMNGALVVLSVAAGIVSIISSASTCRAYCCNEASVVIEQPTGQIPAMVQMQGRPTQQVILVPSQQYPGHFQYAPSQTSTPGSSVTGAVGDLPPQYAEIHNEKSLY